ncbi:ABC transporter substrate-binding protein [Vogesella indigofera]|uniref:ABC transporter substrate-binding protein n=1 Tax=Vogesella indigofera TaxID=45465 RepID=UPI00234ED6BE|nr:ABC transporter substrate-binding protein [Vogesella indigofera]MDC7711552.1 ABC transporter substrate-binding protein [Vogesella indigofera]
MKLAQFVAVAVVGVVSVSVQAKEWKTIRFGVAPAYAPFEYLAPNGKVQGFDIDLGNALCAQLKAKCEWVENDFDGMIPALAARKFDAINSAMNITAKRKEKVSFTEPLYQVPIMLVAKAGSGLLPTAAALKGKSIGTQQGTTQEAYANKHLAPAGVRVVSYQTQELVYADMVSGRLDGTLLDGPVASESFLKRPQGKGFAFAGGPLRDVEVLGVGSGIAVRKEDNELREALNGAFKALKANGTFDRLVKKYFEMDIAAN